MKLHLPKMLLAAVMAIFAIGGTAQAITVTTTYKETSSVYSTAESFNSNGYSYDATTGIITYNHTGGGTQQKLDTTITLNYTNLEALADSSNLVYISTTDKGTWGTRATADGKIIGFLADGADRKVDDTYMSADVLKTYADANGIIKGMTVLIDATANNGNGVQVKVPTTEGGTADVYKDTGLRYTPGNIVYVGIDKNLVSTITLKDLESTTVTAGSWSKTYTADEKLYNVNSDTKIDGGASTGSLNLKAHGGDIIISGENGRLQLNTWSGTPTNCGAISLDNDIYIGTSNDAGALHLAAYSGTINLNGTITLLENSLITKEGNKENKNNMVTIGSSAAGSVAVTDGEGDNFTLTMKKYGDGQKCDYITFAGSVDLGGLTMAGTGGSDVAFGSTVQVGTLTTQDGAHKLTFNGDTELGAISMGAGSSLALAGTGAVSLGGGTLVGAISNTNANLSISGDITCSTSSYTGGYTDGANGYLAGSMTLIDNSGDGATSGNWNVVVDGISHITSSTNADGDVVVQFGEGNTGYYVNEELEYTGNVAAANDIVLKGGTLLLNSALKEGATIYSSAATPGTIKMGAKQTLDNSSVSKAVGGTATLASADSTAVYTLNAANATNPALNVTLGANWTGTVHLKNVTMQALDIDDYANSTNAAASTVLLDGVTGYAQTGTSTYNTNIKLADGNENAFVFNNGNGNDRRTFTGSISGSGSIKRSNSSGMFQYYQFTGNVSEWSGSFINASNDAKAETSVTFSDNAKKINADLTHTVGNGGKLNVMIDNAEDVTMTGTVSATDGTIKLQNLGTGKVTVANVAANGGNVQLSGNGTNAIDIKNLSIKAGNTVSDGKTASKSGYNNPTYANDAAVTVTITDTLSIASSNAIALQGALVLGANVSVSLTGFQVEEGVTSYTLGTAGSISFANGVDFIEATGIKGYTAKVSINTITDPVMVADGAATPATTQSLVLTLTANKPTLTEITINGGSYADGVLTLTTETDIANVVFGDKLNAIMDDTTWETILGNATTTLPDKVLVSITDGQNYIDFDTNDDGTIDTALTINGEGITGTPVVDGIEVNGTPNKGTIVGNYVTAYIPEPTTTTLSLLALAGLAVRRRRASR